MFTESNGPMEVEKQEHLAAVLDQANQLNLAGYQLTIMKDYEKKPIHLILLRHIYCFKNFFLIYPWT